MILKIRGTQIDIPLDDRAEYIKSEIYFCQVEADNFYEAVDCDDADAVDYWREKILDKRLEHYNNYKENLNVNKSKSSD